MKQFAPTLAFASIISLVNGHGFIISPAPRMPGAAMAAACGQQVQIHEDSDNYNDIQSELQVASAQSDFNAAKCDLWLCKGYQFADNKENVQKYVAGQKADFEVDIETPHTGVANVSIVHTSFNRVIGKPLISWDVYASTATDVPDDQIYFSVIIPDDLGNQCSTAGDCVLQWYWDAKSIGETYESCVDFTVGGSGVNSNSSSIVNSSSAVGSKGASTSVPVALETPDVAGAVAAQTTFATSFRPSTTASTEPEVATSAAAVPDAANSIMPFPVDSAGDVLSWIQALIDNLGGN